MNKILLLSYPRSGNSLIKYFIKRSINANVVTDCFFATAAKKNQKVTQAIIDNKVEVNGRLFKEHYSIYCNMFDDKNDALVLVIRNYKECIPRHTKPALYNMTILEQHCDSYMKNIVFYDNWEGPKRVLYYEDLIVDFEKYYCEILPIIDADMKLHKVLFDNLEEHKNICLKQYDKVCGSQTKGKMAIFHSKLLNKEALKVINNCINKLEYKNIQKYIERYKS
jgi:hypothetical protein